MGIPSLRLVEVARGGTALRGGAPNGSVKMGQSPQRKVGLGMNHLALETRSGWGPLRCSQVALQ
jgi:hypothetical protein